MQNEMKSEILTELAPEIDKMFPDYSIYPECNYAIGYFTRGCPNRCKWCIVPKKEGNIRPYRAWQDLVRPDTDKLVLMDNNILTCEYGIEQLAGLIGSGYRIDLNQGREAQFPSPGLLIYHDIVSPSVAGISFRSSASPARKPYRRYAQRIRFLSVSSCRICNGKAQ